MFNIFRRKEKIDPKKLDELTSKQESVTVVSSKTENVEIYVEKEVVKPKVTLDNTLPVLERISIIDKLLLEVASKKDEILKWYYIYKIYIYSVKKDNKFNELKMAIDKDVNAMKRSFEESNRLIRKIKYEANPTDLELSEVFAKVSDLNDFIGDLQRKLNEYRHLYFNYLKVSSLVVTKDKTYDELEKIANRIDELVYENVNFDRLYEYTEYNSGELVNETIDAFIDCMNEVSSKKHTRREFVDTDYVLHLTVNEWIGLYSRFARLQKQIEARAEEINHIKLLKLNKKLKEFEIKYFIILIKMESIS